MKRYIKTSIPAFLILLIICFLLRGVPRENNSINEVFVHFINVGQGDAILIDSKNYNILIDGGPEDCGDHLKRYLDNLKIKNLDFVIATHPHDDHIGFLDNILNRTKVANFIAPAVKADTKEFSNMIASIKRKGLKIQTPWENQKIKLDNNSSMEFLNTKYKYNDDNLNNNSLVIKYTYKDVSFLLTGDSEIPVEENISIHNKDIHCNVLKVGHHGSKSSSSLSFLKKVAPSIAVISCGMGNDYGHPDKITLDNLKVVNTRVYRTDIQGNVILKTDGNKILVKTKK